MLTDDECDAIRDAVSVPTDPEQPFDYDRALIRAAYARRDTEVEALRAALRFYADEANWRSPSTGFALQYDPEPAPAQDRGKRARAALAATP